MCYGSMSVRLSIRPSVANQLNQSTEYSAQRLPSAVLHGYRDLQNKGTSIWNLVSKPDLFLLFVTAHRSQQVLSLNNCFKTRLDKFWSNRDVLYDFKAPFLGTGSRSCSCCDCVVYYVMYTVNHKNVTFYV